MKMSIHIGVLLAISWFGYVSSNGITVECTSCKDPNKIIGKAGGNITVRYIIIHPDFQYIVISYNGTDILKAYSSNLKFSPKNPDRHKRFQFPKKVVKVGSNKYEIVFNLTKLSMLKDNKQKFTYVADVQEDNDLKGENELSVYVNRHPSNNGKDNNNDIVIIIVVCVIILLVIIVVFCVCKKYNPGGYNSLKSCGVGAQPAKTKRGYEPADQDNKDELESTATKPGGDLQQSSDKDIIYSEPGSGGGRIGARSPPEKSHYAEVKNEEDDYSKRGPTTKETETADTSVIV